MGYKQSIQADLKSNLKYSPNKARKKWKHASTRQETCKEGRKHIGGQGRGVADGDRQPTSLEGGEPGWSWPRTTATSGAWVRRAEEPGWRREWWTEWRSLDGGALTLALAPGFIPCTSGKRTELREPTRVASPSASQAALVGYAWIERSQQCRLGEHFCTSEAMLTGLCKNPIIRGLHRATVWALSHPSNHTLSIYQGRGIRFFKPCNKKVVICYMHTISCPCDLISWQYCDVVISQVA